MRSLLRRRAGRPSPAVAPAKPDLLAESRVRGTMAARRESPWRTGMLDALPDPYGPDPVVFGTVPRAGRPW